MRLLDYILSWWSGRRAGPHRPLKFVVYTRQGCHLCDEALQVLETQRKRCNFDIDLIDIDGDPALKDKYGECVPVVALDGKVYFRGKVNPVLLRRLVTGASMKRD
jgi:predicted thioredoxin/glutaredoxin